MSQGANLDTYSTGIVHPGRCSGCFLLVGPEYQMHFNNIVVIWMRLKHENIAENHLPRRLTHTQYRNRINIALRNFRLDAL